MMHENFYVHAANTKAPVAMKGISGMTTRMKPRLVPFYSEAFEEAGTTYIRLTPQQVRAEAEVSLTLEAATWLLPLMTGTLTLAEIRHQLADTIGVELPLNDLLAIVELLDENLLLDTEHYRSVLARTREEFAAQIDRPAQFAGSAYPASPESLSVTLDRLFDYPGGVRSDPHRLPIPAPDEELCGILVPHIDFGRGGKTYTWGFQRLADHAQEATLFVILATSHYSAQRFTLSTKHYSTPLGKAEVAGDFVRTLASAYGPKAFADEQAIIPEHSVEFEVVFLQHVLGHRTTWRIAPILVGSFHDAIDRGVLPTERAGIKRMTAALRETVANFTAQGEKIVYVCSGDLAHLGPKFGDLEPVTPAHADACLEADRLFLDAAATGSATAVHRVVAAEGDARRLCGYPPLYVQLAVMDATRGEILDHDRALCPRGREIVSFASMAFWRTKGIAVSDPPAATDVPLST